jgi:hypothetical protein
MYLFIMVDESDFFVAGRSRVSSSFVVGGWEMGSCKLSLSLIIALDIY